MSDLERLERAIRQFAFDIVMTEFGGDDGDADDQDYATESVDTWMEHWRSVIVPRLLINPPTEEER